MIQHLERPKHQFKRAITFILLSDVFGAGQAIFVKMAMPYFDTNSLAFIRFSINLLILFAYVLFSSGFKGFKTLYHVNTWKYHFVRSIAGVGSIYCFYYGLTHMPIGSAALLFYTFPIFVPLVTRVWLRVAIIHRLWWGLAISFAGIFFLLRPGAGLFNPVALVALLGGIFGSIATVSIRVLHRYSEKVNTIMANFFTFGVIVSGLVFLLSGKVASFEMTFYSGMIAATVGIFSSLFQTLFTTASKYATARFLSPFIYGIFIFVSLGDYLIWGKALHRGTVIGFILISLGTILMIFLYPKDDLTFVPKKKKDNSPNH